MQYTDIHAGKKLKIHKINFFKKKIIKHRHGEMTKWVKAIAAQAKQSELICRTCVKVGARAPKSCPLTSTCGNGALPTNIMHKIILKY